MTISTSNSSVAVTYFDGSGVAISSGTAEADGAEYALLTATVLDSVGAGAAVAGAQVVFELDSATEDRTAYIKHGQAKPNGTGAVSITDASGIATARLYSQDSNNSPLTVNVRAGEDDGKIFGFSAPTTSTAGAAGSHGTTLGATTVSADGSDYTDTQFTGLVRVQANGATFTNCTFNGGGTVANLIRISGELTAVNFFNCTFTDSTGHAIVGTGYFASECHWHTIGLSALNISTPIPQTSITTLDACLIEKVGSVSGSAAISASPGHKLLVTKSKINCPHESSTNAVAGFNGRGVITLTTRRPNSAGNIEFERSWLYGGGDYLINSYSLDSGNTPAALRINSCRIGSAADNQDPAGELSLIRNITDIGFRAQGNLSDADGQLLTALNTHAGVGWYWPSDFIDTAASVTFEVEPWPEATVIPPNTSPTVEAPRADAESAFGTTVYQFPPLATVDPGVANPIGRILDVEGYPLYVDEHRDKVPTARGLYRPKARTESLSNPAGTEVQFAADDTVLSISERNETLNITIETADTLIADVVIGLIYAGKATNGTDYSAPASITMPAGSSSVELPVVIYPDADTSEDDEQVFIHIDSADGALVGKRDVASVTIVDFAEIAASVVPTASFQTTGLTITEGATATFMVQLHRVGATDCTVNYSIPFSQLSMGEYTDVTGGSITIAAGDLTGNVVISTVDDTNTEDQEYLQLQIDSVSAGFTVGENDTATLIVNDNDFVAQAEVQFTQAASQVLESATREIRIMASVPVEGDVVVAFTETRGTNLLDTDYNLVDEFGATITSPITIPDGEQVFLIYFESVDDTIVEADETLTLTLTSSSGNSTLGAQLTHVATILDDDTSGSGSDGDLYGLVPERQAVDLTGAEYDVYPDRYERAANVGLGITAATVNTGGYYLAQAISDSQVYWTALNEAASAGSATVLQDRVNSLHAEGELVRIRVNGDCDSSGNGYVKWSTDPDDTNTAAWASPNLAILRDIVIYGASDWNTDIIGHQAFYDDFREDFGASPATGRRICANIRFERVSIEGNNGFQRNVGAIGLSDVVNDYQTNGFIKFYNCRFTNDRDYVGADRPQKWNVRSLSITAGWDFRSCYSFLALEHFAYVNSPNGGFFVVNCTSIRGGYSTTFCQSVNRAYDAGRQPELSQYGSGNIVFIRNVIWDTSSGDEFRGGADLTVQGQGADCYFVENEHLGLAVHGNGTGRRGAITTYAGSYYIVYTGIPNVSKAYDYDGYLYATKSMHIYGDIVAWENGNGRQTIGLSSCKEIVIRGFSMTGTHFREQFITDKVGVSSGDSLQMINGLPERGAGHGITWDLRIGSWQGEPYTGLISEYPGWHGSVPKMKNFRSRRLANFSSEDRTLTDSNLNTPFDGTPLWGEGGRLPAAQWEDTRLGLPVGGELKVYAGHKQQSRSIREQTWTYSRTFENYTAQLYTETANSVVEYGDGGASGTMTFTYLDNEINWADSEERPEFDITNVQAPTDPSSPGLIRYQLTDTGSNAVLVGSGALDVFVYDPGTFATIQWDQSRYGSAGVATISIANGDQQDLYLESSSPTWMEELCYVSQDATGTTATGTNNYYWRFAPGAVERTVKLVSVFDATPGDVLLLTIETITVEGVTAGLIGTTSLLTVNYTA
tara:strand:+ start:23303 stop:28213 length:4911 start_codon:yes stop_codon:yes gene_type:complete